MCSTRPLVRISAGCLYRTAATTLGGLGVCVFPCKRFRENESHVSHSLCLLLPWVCSLNVSRPGMVGNRPPQSDVITDITGCLIKPRYPCCERKRLSRQPKSFQGSKINFHWVLVLIKVWNISQYPFDGKITNSKLVIFKRFVQFYDLEPPVISEKKQ